MKTVSLLRTFNLLLDFVAVYRSDERSDSFDNVMMANTYGMQSY